MRCLRPMSLILLAGAACALVAAPPAPKAEVKAAALKVFETLHRQDWEGLYTQAAFSQQETERLPDQPEAFAREVKRGIGGGKNQELVDRMLGGMSDLAVGDPEIHGDYAQMSTSCAFTRDGRKHAFKGSIHLIRRKRAWKWDLTFSDDLEEAMSKALAELIGQPADAAVVVK